MAVTILEMTAQKFAERASLGKGGSNIYTPFAERLWETELRHSTGLVVMPTGNGFFNIRNTNVTSPRGNRVHLQLDANPPVMSCTCGYPLRFRVPCREVIAVGKEIKEMERVMGLIDPAYRLEIYRQPYEDPSCVLVLPVLEMIDEDPSLLPPPPEGQSGRPKKGPPPGRRIPSKGEKAASAANNVRMSELPGATPSAGGLSQGSGALSQGAMSQGAPAAPINIG